MNEFVDLILQYDPQARVVVLGDLNTFEFTNDLTEILPGEEPILANLIGTLNDDNVYTFNFEGNSQVLDHVFEPSFRGNIRGWENIPPKRIDYVFKQNGCPIRVKL